MEMILAFDDEYGIGKNNTLPWHFKEDLMRFKAITMGSILIMGRKTYESLPNGPLPARTHIVVSRESCPNEPVGDVIWATNYDDAYQLTKHFSGERRVFVIGGKSAYEYYINKPYLNTVHVTHVSGGHQCDVKLNPNEFKFHKDQWTETKEYSLENPFLYEFATYKRIIPNAA